MKTVKKYIIGLDYRNTIVLDTMKEALDLIEKLMVTIIPTDRITVRTIHTTEKDL